MMTGGMGLDVLSTMAPEQRAQFMQHLLGQQGLENKDETLQDQIAQARALQHGRGVQGYGAWGGALNGLADVLDSVNGTMREKKALAEREALQPQFQAGNKALIDALSMPSSMQAARNSKPLVFKDAQPASLMPFLFGG